MATEINKTFRDTKVSVDGNEYQSCTFVKAVLVYSGGEPASFPGCTFDTCLWRFEEPAGRVIKMLQYMAKTELRGYVEGFFPDLNR